MLTFLLAMTGIMETAYGVAIKAKSLNASPAMNVDFPDPSILNAGGTWYAYATSGNGAFVQVATSNDFGNWQLRGGWDALASLPGWVDLGDPSVWAPNVVQIVSGSQAIGAVCNLYARTVRQSVYFILLSKIS
jgi:beta-xylosidase